MKLYKELIHSIVELNLLLSYLPPIPMDRAGSLKKPGERRKNITSCHRSLHVKIGSQLEMSLASPHLKQRRNTSREDGDSKTKVRLGAQEIAPGKRFMGQIRQSASLMYLNNSLNCVHARR